MKTYELMSYIVLNIINILQLVTDETQWVIFP